MSHLGMRFDWHESPHSTPSKKRPSDGMPPSLYKVRPLKQAITGSIDYGSLGFGGIWYRRLRNDGGEVRANF